MSKPQLADIIARVPVETILLENGITSPKRHGVEWRIRCVNPNHADEDPSLDVNQRSGLAICRSCGWRGDISKVIALHVFKGDNRAAWQWLLKRARFDSRNVFNRNGNEPAARLSETHAIARLRKRGLRDETIQHFNIIADLKHQAWTYLVTVAGEEVARRFKSFDSNRKPKYWWPKKEVDDRRFFVYGLDDIPDGAEEIWLVGGEPDLWTCWQARISAIAFLGGEGTVKREYFDAIRQHRPSVKRVRVCFDADNTGKKGMGDAVSIGTKAGFSVTAYDIEPRANRREKFDITDLYNDLQCDDAGLRQALELLPSIKVGGAPRVTLTDSDRITVQIESVQGPVEFCFSEIAIGTRELDAEMEMRLLVDGTSTNPYVQRLNLLSASARDACRRELDGIYGRDPGWSKLLSTACSAARTAYLQHDRAVHVPDIAAPPSVSFVMDRVIPENGPTILFGAGSAGKTFIAIAIAVSMSCGEPFLSFRCEKRNVLFIDYETGPETFGLRVARIMRGLDRTQDEARGIFYWNAGGIPLPDQTEGIRQCVSRNNIGFLVIDHAGAACGAEPEKADSALRFYRALGRIQLPTLVLAHITGDDERNPASVRKPFGSVMWANGARRTWFVQRQQEQESDEIEIGLFCRKCNDGRYPADIGLRLIFDGEGGPVYIEKADLRDNPELEETRTIHRRIWDVLTQPKIVDDIVSEIDVSEGTVRKVLNRHPKLFVRVTEGHKGQGAVWARKAMPDAYTD